MELFSYLNNSSEEEISFNEYYSYYMSANDFQRFIDNQLASSSFGGDCGWWCLLGCGSDHGCCGNYSGCCLYWNPICYIHDRMCTDCEPAWFCLPGCKPDVPEFANVSIE